MDEIRGVWSRESGLDKGRRDAFGDSMGNEKTRVCSKFGQKGMSMDQSVRRSIGGIGIWQLCVLNKFSRRRDGGQRVHIFENHDFGEFHLFSFFIFFFILVFLSGASISLPYLSEVK